MKSSVSTSWQAEQIQTAGPGFIVTTGSVGLNNKFRMVLAFTRDFFSFVFSFLSNELL